MRFASTPHALLVTACVIASASIARDARADPPRSLAGWATYDRYCVACHGANGDGRGPAAPYVSPRPRDFTRGEFLWRSAPVGTAPADEDLRATIYYGTGGGMPGFASVLSERELDDTVVLIEAFAPSAFAGPRGVAVPLPQRSTGTRDVARGAALWTQSGCPSCHGASGKGDTPIHPFDLTTHALRRPLRDPGDRAESRVVADLLVGIAGAMPSYAGVIQGDDLWALADYVVSIGPTPSRSSPVFGTLDPQAIAADRDAATPLVIGTRPSGGDADEDALFGSATAPQGRITAWLPPAEASLRARQCGRCHAKQLREWTGSIHGAAASPGVRAQIDVMPTEQAASCARCHTPLAEQQPSATPDYDAELQQEGVTCAGCHVRGGTRHGPPNVAPSLLPLPGYPLQTLAIYERSDLCMTCHQLPPRTAVGGRPLLNTYAEWLDGPYSRVGVQCQHCHMPNREHTVLGIHDRETVRQAIDLSATSAVRGPRGVVGVAAILRNVGAGHMLPTTTTPAIWLAAELLDAHGAVIAGSRRAKRIGRDMVYRADGWHEREDSRIAPGETAVLVDGWSGDRTVGATAVRVQVVVRPDDYYEGFYAQKLAEQPAPPQRALYEQALARARASGFVADERVIPL